MDINDYQAKAAITALYPNELKGGIFYPSLGLAGEVGELLNKIKKIARDNATPDKDGIKAELGDILWYVARIASEMDITMDEIANYNIEKLAKRKENGTIHGNGDYR
ncbi:nucleoside triphosphate pyrophosphohydrolase family protein [Candidatus Marsarchaeota archaeon]|jgi:NTP pyrophosphatase (non-canonical NTP hydrolase)|nr:nucleoside triphosphate pyrophosphohydrolase family protein [Candidatus Marsarchaeota archaeon]MCL5099758.1 nucleoside triphosphate pyrophosphohydrolase family protein [Candidatus Marsarchaeota archaeon]